MTTAKGYAILTEDIHDDAAMHKYERASTAALVEYGGRVLVADDPVRR